MNAREALCECLRADKALWEHRLVEALRSPVESAALARPFERAQSLNDLLNLSKGEDAMYDRPTVGTAYALWYQPQRMQDAVRGLLHVLAEREDDVRIVDIGSGTGATWWAVAAIERARHSLGLTARKVTIDALDPSLPMMETAEAMWGALREAACDEAALLPDVRRHLRTIGWFPGFEERSIAIASYLFDSSDGSRASAVGSLLNRMLEEAGVTQLVAIGSPTKEAIIRLALPRARVVGDPPPAVWTGPVKGLGPLRQQLVEGLNNSTLESYGSKVPTWTSGARVHRMALEQRHPNTLDLGVRTTGLVLDERQIEASQPDKRMTAVIGAAGSGKSRVLVERLVLTLQQQLKSRGTTSNILVTGFNKRMLNQLADWFSQERDRIQGQFRQFDDNGVARFTFSERHTVKFMTWDTVMFRIFEAKASVDVEAFRTLLLRPRTASQRKAIEVLPWITEEFLEAELQRVVYGRGVMTKDDYLKVERQGAGRPLSQGQRDLIWSLLDPLNRQSTFIDRRREALRRVRSAEAAHNKRIFDFVFVDECQDFVPADFELLRHLVTDTRNLSVFGDETQALHIGAAYRRPGSLGDRRWKQHTLAESYRLPLRVCEAIAPIARELQRSRSTSRVVRVVATEGGGDDMPVTDIITPDAVKNSPEGVRPILLAGTRNEVHRQVGEVLGCYRRLLEAHPAGTRRITIAESDERMKKAATDALSRGSAVGGCEIESATMRSIKGLERPVVLWSTASRMDSPDTEPEWIYTILSRTTNLLVIGLSQHTKPEVRSVVAKLEPTRVMPWTVEAAEMFAEWRFEAEEPF